MYNSRTPFRNTLSFKAMNAMIEPKIDFFLTSIQFFHTMKKCRNSSEMIVFGTMGISGKIPTTLRQSEVFKLVHFSEVDPML